jgi:hypothetical protein
VQAVLFSTKEESNMPFSDFTNPKKAWRISNPGGSNEKMKHVILFCGDETPGGTRVRCLDDSNHRYPKGTYAAGPPQTISDGSYVITYIPGTPLNQIQCANSPVMGGSWTADDSGSDEGNE